MPDVDPYSIKFHETAAQTFPKIRSNEVSSLQSQGCKRVAGGGGSCFLLLFGTFINHKEDIFQLNLKRIEFVKSISFNETVKRGSERL